MAARTRYPAPHVQLRELAVVARREGLTFEEFWVRAMRPGEPPTRVRDEEAPYGAVRWPSDTTDRNLCIAALAETREGWRRAYEGMPGTRSEVAVIILRPLLDGRALPEGEAVPSAA